MHKKIILPTNKKFGIFFTFVFIVSSFYFFYLKNQYVAIILIFLSSYFFVITFFKLKQLSVLNIFWFKFGQVLGRIVSPIVLGIIYFLIITPVAIIIRIIGRDELSLKNNNRLTHWKKRANQDYKRKNFEDQF
tara:strand:+ start:1386 stop:1784 length:399 start_codon:yes stop_codon:yes gene_type:complete